MRTKQTTSFTTCTAFIILVTAPTFSQTIPAFPGAEGYGRFAEGGRGGRIVFVTNTNDDGPGSLRQALDATGPRIIVFQVGGLIDLTSGPLIITEPHVTIAGQTAPGDGICVKAGYASHVAPFFFANTHDVIIRYIRVRPGTNNGSTGRGAITFFDLGNGGDIYNIMVDHCSVSWASDEQIQVYGSNGTGDMYDITIQNCISAEALPVIESWDCQCGSMAGGTNKMGQLTWYRNLFAHNSHRNPASGNDHETENVIQIINNLSYNHSYLHIMLNPYHFDESDVGITNANVIANYLKDGPSGMPSNHYEVSMGYGVHAYVGEGAYGNRSVHRTDDATDEWAVCGDNNGNPAPESRRSYSAFDSANLPPYVTASEVQDEVSIRE